ncbi:riboflavin synthase [Leucobacter sp. OH2974_COT-288]|uniref:Riboflavin synthase n=1 Tax=Canibacter oris TaxID=1365628 RepID=A0A840DEM4_9MICO|nr:riboflavin synthase [Canibacter oris]RRD35034.1 riboflavin synthase [Leucobacter sp. OH2974_COT-288]
MFTGLIETLGTVTAVQPLGDGVRLNVRAPEILGDVQHGDSIAVNGVCLTVIAFDAAEFSADVMQQTLEMSSLSEIAVGSRVNLERAAQIGSRLGGHIVQGHVDATATVTEVRPGDKWQVLRFELPRSVAPLLVDKGSITVDGVSLTISNLAPAAAAPQWFEVSLIPETLSATTMGDMAVGDRVNLETDMVARHVARLAEFGMPLGGALAAVSTATHPTAGQQPTLTQHAPTAQQATTGLHVNPAQNGAEA